MQQFIFQLAAKDIHALGTVRCMAGLQAAADDQYIWLKGVDISVAINVRLRQLPVQHTFILDGQDHLFLTGGCTPVDILKQLNWQPLDTFIQAEAPVAALPGKTSSPVMVQLVVSAAEREGRALLTTLKAWKMYADTAPAVRLQAIEFAVAENGDVLILGYPLPSLPGKQYWMEDDILLPCGYEFAISLATVFINEQLNKSKDAILLFDTDGQWQRIERNYFVTGKRSAVRLTQVKHD